MNYSEECAMPAVTQPHFFCLWAYNISDVLKGGCFLATYGYLQVHAYTSNAQIPLKDVAVAITDTSGTAIALRLTNSSGLLNETIQIDVPDLSASQSPNTGVIPFATVNLYARLENYEQIEVENIQIFANTVTLQNLAFIPLSELPGNWNQAEIFDTPPQNL